jgi:hypothetical protein
MSHTGRVTRDQSTSQKIKQKLALGISLSIWFFQYFFARSFTSLLLSCLDNKEEKETQSRLMRLDFIFIFQGLFHSWSFLSRTCKSCGKPVTFHLGNWPPINERSIKLPLFFFLISHPSILPSKHTQMKACACGPLLSVQYFTSHENLKLKTTLRTAPFLR